MMSPGEIERARAAVSVTCLRWLRSEVEAVHPPRPPVVRDREGPVRVVEPPAESGPRHHPLWDRWIDG